MVARERLVVTKRADESVLPRLHPERCSSCWHCVDYCPTDALVAGEEGYPVIVRPTDCAYCGICEDLCPEGAIELVYEIVSAPHGGS